jgi:serine/threonine protein kinase
MGVVYQAWDDELGVAVALKVIKPEVSADPRVAAEVEHRFKREFLLARQVTHKHVVRTHDIGEMDGVKYLTMPFIEGRDLAHALRDEGRLPVARALQIARQIAEGLAAAHEAGVVHRDLKPENVMIDADEQAVIMDFGISRSETTADGTMTRTATGTIVGTMEYMAPEQASGQRTDHRADIYSLGLILYDMLAGRSRVAKAGTAIAELTERLQTPPRPLPSAAPSVPAVDAIIARCTRADPAKRYQTAAELVADLNLLGADGQPLRRARVPRAPRWRRRSSRPARHRRGRRTLASLPDRNRSGQGAERRTRPGQRAGGRLR